METTKPADFEDVLKTVLGWPASKRFTLVQAVLETLAPEKPEHRPRRKTAEKALGLLATDEPAPSDEEVEQWLEEERSSKAGLLQLAGTLSEEDAAAITQAIEEDCERIDAEGW